jgi:hypothetical protein
VRSLRVGNAGLEAAADLADAVRSSRALTALSLAGNTIAPARRCTRCLSGSDAGWPCRNRLRRLCAARRH